MAQQLRVAVIGAGALGQAITARLVETGHEVLIWDRHGDTAADAARQTGATAVESVRDAVAGAQAVLTVLTDGDVVADVITDHLDAFLDSAVWVQVSTVGPASARRLAQLADEHGVAFLDAPVSGSTQPARNGELVWLVSGQSDALDRVRPVLEHLGSDVQHVGEQQQGSAVKLAVNAWMTAATVAMSDVLGLCDDLGVEPDTFITAIQAGPLAMPYVLQKIEMMRAGTYPAGFATHLALKDLDLAAQSATPSPLLTLLTQRLQSAIAAGHGDDDLAAVDAPRHRAPGR